MRLCRFINASRMQPSVRSGETLNWPFLYSFLCLFLFFEVTCGISSILYPVLTPLYFYPAIYSIMYGYKPVMLSNKTLASISGGLCIEFS